MLVHLGEVQRSVSIIPACDDRLPLLVTALCSVWMALGGVLVFGCATVGLLRLRYKAREKAAWVVLTSLFLTSTAGWTLAAASLRITLVGCSTNPTVRSALVAFFGVSTALGAVVSLASGIFWGCSVKRSCF